MGFSIVPLPARDQHDSNGWDKVWRPIDKPLKGLAMENTVNLETVMRFDGTSIFGEWNVVSRSMPCSGPVPAPFLPSLHDTDGGE